MLLLLLRQMVEVAVDSASLIACKLQKSSSFLIKFRLSRGRGGDVWSFVEFCGAFREGRNRPISLSYFELVPVL
jgi:hypothetical protein